jgi:hypothetical protein
MFHLHTKSLAKEDQSILKAYFKELKFTGDIMLDFDSSSKDEKDEYSLEEKIFKFILASRVPIHIATIDS